MDITFIGGYEFPLRKQKGYSRAAQVKDIKADRDLAIKVIETVGYTASGLFAPKDIARVTKLIQITGKPYYEKESRTVVDMLKGGEDWADINKRVKNMKNSFFRINKEAEMKALADEGASQEKLIAHFSEYDLGASLPTEYYGGAPMKDPYYREPLKNYLSLLGGDLILMMNGFGQDLKNGIFLLQNTEMYGHILVKDLMNEHDYERI
jgi:hypothetical protein